MLFLFSAMKRQAVKEVYIKLELNKSVRQSES